VGTSGEPGFSPNWHAVPSSPLGFRKEADGRIFLKGQASPQGGWGSEVFVLPPGYRPPSEVELPVLSDALPSEMLIEPDGRVVPTTPSSGYDGTAYFDGMSFSDE